MVEKTHDGTRSGGIRRYGRFRDGIDDSIRARCGGGIRGGEKKDTPPEPEDPVRRRTSGRQRRASLEEYRETYLTVPKIRNRKTVFVSEDVRDELDAVVRRLGGRGMSVSGLLENLAREHLAAYRGDIEQWRKI